jgi:hypothetical protein
LLLDEFTLFLELLEGSLLVVELELLLTDELSLLLELLLLLAGSLVADELLTFSEEFILDVEFPFAGSLVALDPEFILLPLSLVSELPFETLVAFAPLLSSAREVVALELSIILPVFVVGFFIVVVVVVVLLLPLLLPLIKRPLPPL